MAAVAQLVEEGAQVTVTQAEALGPTGAKVSEQGHDGELVGGSPRGCGRRQGAPAPDREGDSPGVLARPGVIQTQGLSAAKWCEKHHLVLM